MNKNIDHIFKDKLKDFKATPSSKVWDNIAAELPQKKKRRILPMWWFGSAAAILILALFLFPLSEDINEEPSLKEETIIVSTPEKENKIDSITIIKNNEPVIVSNNVKNNKENAVTISKKNQKKIPKNIVESDKKLSDLVDTKIAKNEVKPVVKSAMKKIFTQKNEKDKLIPKKDSLVSITKPKKDLVAEVSKDKQKDNLLQKKETGKWSLTPVVALLSSKSFSGNSPLDETLANNPTEGTNSFSYGVKVAYQINNKWEIQSGIHIQKTDYVNNNLSIISNVSGSGLSGLQSNASFSLGSTNSGNALPFLSGAKVISSTANLTQTYGYIEVPLEIKYTFLESKKFKSKIVTGFSSLFLNENDVFVDSDVLSQKVGEANNLNSINFSGNFGLDFDYSINNNFKLNFNPMFKVQLNTYSKNSNGFKPYLLGFYSGIKYQF